MSRSYRLLLTISVCLAVLNNAAAEGKIDFNRDIRPILSDKCFACHGPDDQHREANLRLDTRDGAIADHKGTRAIVPGSLEDSELIYRITTTDEDDLMPPKKSHKELSETEIAKLKQWIEEGAGYESQWIYKLPVKHEAPVVAGADHVIDRFIRASLIENDLEPAPEADRVTLLRRLSFDLTGLPPSAEEVAAFVVDSSPDAYEKQVERLLASPHFGERMAAKWLDLVRYADTVGFHGDQNVSVSPYRDYVISAFNSNMRYDQFTRENLAGDLLPDATLRQKVASGYNRLNMTTEEGGAQPKEYLAKYAGDRVRNVSAVWMGGTLGCAECHAHKFDPYSTEDFYSMAAFFADLQEVGKYGARKRPPEIPVPPMDSAKRIAEIEAEIAQLKKKLPPEAPDISAKQNELKSITSSVPTMPISVAVPPRVIRVLPRGNWMDESGAVVEPAIPSFLGKLETGGKRPTRLDLANWFVSPQNPMTARTFVNHLWHLYFGAGISNVLSDLGNQGEPPVHPELLDWLAVEFVESGWNIKHMIKFIVISQTYRQSSKPHVDLSEIDPNNRLLSRQSPRRLTAEMVRDNALAISGLLVDRVGGISVHPYQPAGYYSQLNFPARKYKHSTDDNQWRRAVYSHWQRTFLHPALQAFDAPTREACSAQRPVSNTPLQALVLMNDPSYVEAARTFAERMIKQGGDSPVSIIEYAWTTALSRPPTPEQSRVLESVYTKHKTEYLASPEEAKQLLRVGQRPLSDLDTADLAAWTSVARVLLNLHETITRN